MQVRLEWERNCLNPDINVAYVVQEGERGIRYRTEAGVAVMRVGKSWVMSAGRWYEDDYPLLAETLAEAMDVATVLWRMRDG